MAETATEACGLKAILLVTTISAFGMGQRAEAMIFKSDKVAAQWDTW